jgi:hypothetical protein
MYDISTPSDCPQQLTDTSCVDKVISHMLASSLLIAILVGAKITCIWFFDVTTVGMMK